MEDFVTIQKIFEETLDQTKNAYLLFTGDIVHGPHIAPADWPSYLGDYYKDQSAELLAALIALQTKYPARVHTLLGNHEHGHIGGPHTAKFARDEVVLLEYTLGDQKSKEVRDLILTWPVIAIAPCGVVFTHGAPAAAIDSLKDIENLDITCHRKPIIPFASSILAKILRSRTATQKQTEDFLSKVGGKVAVFGHEVVPLGFEKIGTNQIVVSTSFGLKNHNKTYLRLNLSKQYTSTSDLREEYELLRLYSI